MPQTKNHSDLILRNQIYTQELKLKGNREILTSVAGHNIVLGG